MRITVGSEVTKVGDSVTDPELGTVETVDGRRARVNWGWVTAWETLRSLQPVDVPTPAVATVATTEPADSLPALIGRPADLDLATADRVSMLDRLNAEITTTAGDVPADVLNELVAIYREVALRQTDASWWLLNVTYAVAPTVARLFTDGDKGRLAELRARRTA